MNKLACFFFFNAALNSVGGHFWLARCWEQDVAFMDISSPWANPFVFPFPDISQWKVGLEDSENVCSDCWWWYCVSINHKCTHRSVKVCFILISSSSSPPPLYRPPPLSLFPVFLTSPTHVVPVHSIRLEYGCVVVDTCSVWSVSRCCRDVLLLVVPSSMEQRLKQWRQKMKGGDPGS